MAFVAGKNIALTLNGVTFTGFSSNVSLVRNGETLDVTTFGDSDREFIQGLRSATMSISGYFDPNNSTGPDKGLADMLADNDGFTFTLDFGTSSPISRYSGSALLSSYETTSDVAGVISFSGSLQCTGAVTRTSV